MSYFLYKNVLLASLLTISLINTKNVIDKSAYSITECSNEETTDPKFAEDVISILKCNYEIANDIKSELDPLQLKKAQEYLQNMFSEASGIPPIDFTLKHENNVIGFCSCEMDKKTRDYHIYMISIHPDYRNQGLGEFFLTELLNRFKEQGAQTVSLTAHVFTNSAAIKLYEKVGFECYDYDEETNMASFYKTL